LGEAQKQINCEAADLDFGGSSFVCFGSKADIAKRLTDVRSTAKSGHW
jgi:hypothetical protein